jgi:hypothetical protein
VHVFCGRSEKKKHDLIFSTSVTLVSIDEQGGKKPLAEAKGF